MKIIIDSLPYDSSSCPFNFADSWGYSLCPCYCKGDKCKYDIYPDIKQKALKEKQSKQNAKK